VGHDTLQKFTAIVIEEAAREGNRFVIAGSSQCILNHYPNVFEVLVFAPLQKSLPMTCSSAPDAARTIIGNVESPS
jgi:hypothetical protein